MRPWSIRCPAFPTDSAGRPAAAALTRLSCSRVRTSGAGSPAVESAELPSREARFFRFSLMSFSAPRSMRRMLSAVVSSIWSPPWSSRRPCWAASRSCVRRWSAPSSRPRWTNSFGATVIFSRMEDVACGFSLILSIQAPPHGNGPRHAARPIPMVPSVSEGLVVISLYSRFFGKLSIKGTMALPHLMRPRPESTLVM